MNTVETVDARTDHMPSVSVPKGATISAENSWTAPDIKNAYQEIILLVEEQDKWLHGVHHTANEQLYLILQRCYHLYQLMSSDKSLSANLKAAIERHNRERNLGIDMNSHMMTNIIKVVFGADRRRASSYSTALRVALTEKVKVENIPQFMRDAGGVEEVRRSQTNGGDPKVDKIQEATNRTKDVSLAVIVSDQIASVLDCAAIGKKVVLLASQDVNGTLNVNAVVQSENVTKAVLTAIYNDNHKDWQKSGASEQSGSDEAELARLLNAAAA